MTSETPDQQHDDRPVETSAVFNGTSTAPQSANNLRFGIREYEGEARTVPVLRWRWVPLPVLLCLGLSSLFGYLALEFAPGFPDLTDPNSPNTVAFANTNWQYAAIGVALIPMMVAIMRRSAAVLCAIAVAVPQFVTDKISDDRFADFVYFGLSEVNAQPYFISTVIAVLCGVSLFIGLTLHGTVRRTLERNLAVGRFH